MQLRTHRFVFQWNLLERLKQEIVCTDLELRRSKACSTKWQSLPFGKIKKLSRNTYKKTKTYLLFIRELSESSFEVEMGLCLANLFIIPDNIPDIHSIWIG